MKVEVLVDIPEVPMSFEFKHGLMKDAGFNYAHIMIEDIPDESLESIGREWTRRLLEKAKKLRYD